MLTKMMVIEIDDIYYNINSSKNVMHAFEYFMKHYYLETSNI